MSWPKPTEGHVLWEIFTGKRCNEGNVNVVRIGIIILSLLFLSPCASAGEKILLVTDEWIPYVNPYPDNPGLISEIVIAAFDAAGLEVEIKFRPWRRCALMVEDGTAFGAFPYAATEKRRDYAWFSDPMWKCHNVFFYLKGRLGDFDFTKLEDLREMVIAGTSGNYYEGIFAEKGLVVDYAPGEASGVRKLWEYRADLFAEAEVVGWTLINRIFPNSVHMFAATPTPWNIKPQRIMISKKYPDARLIMDRFNDGLRAIRADGTYARIVRAYMAETLIHPQ